MKPYIRIGLFLIILVIVTFTAKSILLGGHPVIELSEAPPLSGALSQSLAASGSSDSLPVVNKDYSIKNIKYFDSSGWAVATVERLKTETDPAVVVLQQINGAYQVVLGPGTAFPVDYLASMPSEVAQELNNRGAVYESGE